MEAEPRRVGRYAVVAMLGAGAMGEVLRARDERLGREVAVKTVRNRFGLDPAQFHARFESEARALAALSHPAIVQVHDLGVDEQGEPYLVMELVDGPTLKARLAERGPMPAAEARAMGIQLARGLEVAHARGITHRDVKPANILLAPNGQWKLADFGVAHVPDSSQTMTGQFLGTPAYAAPEALTLGHFGAASDVFGLAAVMVEAITGRRLRGDATMTELAARAGETIALPPEVPADLAAVLRPALARDPSQRPSAAALAEMLATGDSTISRTEIVTPSRPRGPAWVLGGIAAGIVLIGIVAALSRSGDGSSSRPRGPVPPAASMRGSEPAHFDRGASKDLEKVIEKANEGKIGDALKKLDKLERKHGETAQTRALREQLEAYEYDEYDD